MHAKRSMGILGHFEACLPFDEVNITTAARVNDSQMRIPVQHYPGAIWESDGAGSAEGGLDHFLLRDVEVERQNDSERAGRNGPGGAKHHAAHRCPAVAGVLPPVRVVATFRDDRA